MGRLSQAVYWRTPISRFTLKLHQVAGCLLIAFAVQLATSQVCRAQPAHALVPLETPFFGIDRFSTSVSTGTAGIHARDILDKEGPHVVISGAGLGLASVNNDELDDFSVNRDVVTFSDHFVILFSVDKASTGGAAPDPFLSANNRPFNVLDQAAKHQAHGDIFMSTETFTRLGPDPIMGEDLPVPHASPDNNTLAKNQGDTGGVDLDLKKDIPPEVPTPTVDPSDELDGISDKDASSTFAQGVPGFPGIFYTLRNGSPSLDTLTPSGLPRSGANIFFDLNPLVPGDEHLYASVLDLNLIPGTPPQMGDDIDALVVFDNGDGVYQPSVDQIMYSLTRGSPSLLGGQFSPADIFMRSGNTTTRLATAARLGLAQTDNIDAIEIKVTTNVDQTLFNTAIFQVIPGDFDGNGVLDGVDCGPFESCYSGPGVTFDTNGVSTVNVAVGPGAVFSPPIVTIQTGDSVRWIWMGGLHNVVSGNAGVEDGAFSSGVPTATVGNTYTVTFGGSLMNLFPHNQGVYPYFSITDPNITGVIHVMAHPCAVYDLDYDGDVDCNDWHLFRAYYQYFAADSSCLPLTVPEFIAALLNFPGPPVNTCMADVNEDGVVNGRDIRPYVATLVH